MAEFMRMARSGRVWLIGYGSARLNPIHGADTAAEVMRLLNRSEGNTSKNLGGPEIFTMREIGELPFRALGKASGFSSVSPGLVRAFAACARPFNTNLAGLTHGLAAMSVHDGVAPGVGSHRLGDF